MISNGLKLLGRVEGLNYYRFQPSFGHWYYENYPAYRRRSLPHRIRMFLEWVQAGYEIVYQTDAEDQILGYVTVVRGGSRLKCSTPRDIVLGPILILSAQRGKGFGTKAIHAVLHDLGYAYENAYEYIKPSNKASIRSAEKNDYELIGSASEKGLMRRLTLSESGEYLVYRYRNQG